MNLLLPRPLQPAHGAAVPFVNSRSRQRAVKTEHALPSQSVKNKSPAESAAAGISKESKEQEKPWKSEQSANSA
jgi:hypothetical protein